jgi:anti-anti-sigma factor
MPPQQVLAHSIGRRADALPPAFECSYTNCGLDAAWVHLAGELDIATAPRLERLLREPRSQTRVIVLDLRNLAFIDSSGVHTILDACIRFRRAGRRMLLLRAAARATTACSRSPGAPKTPAMATYIRSSHPSRGSRNSSRRRRSDPG